MNNIKPILKCNNFELREYIDPYKRLTGEFEVVDWFVKKGCLGEQTSENILKNTKEYKVCTEVMHLSRNQSGKYIAKITNLDRYRKIFETKEGKIFDKQVKMFLSRLNSN